MLERRDSQRRYGLVWEREGIEPERALNDDFVALDLDPALSTAPLDERGWCNLVIEGDNWDALRALRLAYAGQVRCILIDPPYNTGAKDFTYNDRYVGAQDRYRQSTWLEFLYRRLVAARDLLAEDGAILVCINDENRAHLDLLMEQVFPGLRVGSFVWRTKDTNNSDKQRRWSGVHEHVLVYANAGFSFIGEQAGEGKFQMRPDLADVPVRLDPVTKPETYKTRAGTYYPVQDPNTGLWYPCAPNQVWRFWSETKPPRGKPKREESMEALIRAGDIHFPAESKPPLFYSDRPALDAAITAGDVPRDGRRRPMLRADLPDLDFWVGKPIAHGRLSRIVRWTAESADAVRPVGSWIAGITEAAGDDAVELLRSDRQGAATTEIERVFGEKAFSFPKPSSLIRAMVRATTPPGGLVLDFFAGSGTTAEAVLALNAEDEGGRRFVLVSNTEATVEVPDRSLCRDVCAERVRRALADPTRGLDGDFAYLRARRVAWDDVLYEFGHAALWTVIQLRAGRALRPFDPAFDVQATEPDPDAPDVAVLAYVPRATEASTTRLRQLAMCGPVIAFSPVPGLLRDMLAMPAVAIEQVPDRLLAEFPRTAMGG